MIHCERVTEDIFVFVSELYVQVTASVIATGDGLVVIDTLLYPEETRQMIAFIQKRLKQPVRYIINTHHHADHTMGTCFFGDAQVVAHRTCRDLLAERGRESLQRAKQQSPEMADVELVLPSIIFDETLTLPVGTKTLYLQHMPGHSPDSIVVHVQEDEVLFAADTMMPLPFFVDGDYKALRAALERLTQGKYETIVQGHADIVLRGEMAQRLQQDIAYLDVLGNLVDQALSSTANSADLDAALATIQIEDCGKTRVLLQGAAQALHRQNVLALAAERRKIVMN